MHILITLMMLVECESKDPSHDHNKSGYAKRKQSEIPERTRHSIAHHSANSAHPKWISLTERLNSPTWCDLSSNSHPTAISSSKSLHRTLARLVGFYLIFSSHTATGNRARVIGWKQNYINFHNIIFNSAMGALAGVMRGERAIAISDIITYNFDNTLVTCERSWLRSGAVCRRRNNTELLFIWKATPSQPKLWKRRRVSSCFALSVSPD